MKIGLANIDVYLTPRNQNYQVYYLCCDFVDNSSIHVANNSVQQFPVLQRLNIDERTRMNGQSYSALKENYPCPLMIASRRNEVENFRLYLVDSTGQIPSFNDYQLRCTLVCSPITN